MKKAVLQSMFFFLLVAWPAASQSADVSQWARQFQTPGFDIIWSTYVGFGRCFAINPNDKQWHDCADKEGVVSESYVEQETNVEYQFTVTNPGKCYSVMEAFIDKDAWLYKHVKIFFYKYRPSTGEWETIAGPGRVYSALFKGNDLLYNYDEAVKISNGQNPLPHVKNPDGTVTLKTVLPVLETGTYKILFRSADRGPEVFLPSKANFVIFLSPEHPTASGTLPQPSAPGAGQPSVSTPTIASPPVGSHKTVLNPAPQPPVTTASGAGNLSGKWEITCTGGIVYKFDLWIEQSGNHFIGNMIRTNGNEPYTSLEGTIGPDGTLKFTRSTGNWRQYYIGKLTRQSGTRPVAMEGKFGNQGQENMDWNAVKLPIDLQKR